MLPEPPKFFEFLPELRILVVEILVALGELNFLLVEQFVPIKKGAPSGLGFLEFLVDGGEILVELLDSLLKLLPGFVGALESLLQCVNVVLLVLVISDCESAIRICRSTLAVTERTDS